MKIKEGYIKRNVAGENIVVAVGGESVKLNGMLNLNETANFLWDFLEKGICLEHLAEKLNDKFGIELNQAREDVKSFTNRLFEAGILYEEN